MLRSRVVCVPRRNTSQHQVGFLNIQECFNAECTTFGKGLAINLLSYSAQVTSNLLGSIQLGIVDCDDKHVNLVPFDLALTFSME